MEPGADSSKWQTATANGHTCQVALGGGGDVEPVAKRARTVAPHEPADRVHPESSDDCNSALSQLRARHRKLIRAAMASRSILLVSYNGKAPSLMRPTSWAKEPYTFWTRYVGDNSKESETTYSLCVARVDDIVSFD